MWGQLLVQCGAILWVVQAAHAKGYGAASGISNGHGPRLNGNHPPNSGVGRFLIPSKGVGAQSGYGGYPTKGIGYGAAAGVAHGTKGYGAAAGGTNGYGGKPHGYGSQGPVSGPGLKGNGYGAQAGQGSKGYGAALGLNGAKQNGHGAAASAQYGLGTKGNGQGAAAGSSNNFGVRPGQGEAQHKPMKGYGRPPHGSVKGPGVGMGAFRGLGVPQFARNPGKAYGRNGYGAQPAGGYNGAYGPAGWGLGSPYGQKGPKQGYGGAAAQPNGQHGKPKGYGNVPSGFGVKQKGYGASKGGTARPQTGYGAGVPKPRGAKPNGYGLALGGYGSQLNGYGAGSKPQTTKGLGAASPSQGAKTLGTGYNVAAGVQNGQIARAASSGYGMSPNGKATETTGASNNPTLYVLSPEQLNPALLGGQGSAPAAPEPTSGVLVRATPEQHHNLLSPVPHGKTYKQPPEASLQHLPVLLQGKGPKPAPQPTPEPVHMGPEGPAAVLTQGNPPPGPAVVLPEGYVTGSAVPEQKGVEEDVLFGVDRPAEGDAAPESTEPLKTRALPELASAKGTGSITPEETLTLGEANTKTQPEAGPDRPGVKGLPAGETGAMGASVKGWGAESSKPDCDPSVPNGQWMKIPRPGLKGGAEASAGTITKGYSASAGAYPNGGAANKPAFGAGGFLFPGLVPGYGAGLGYPYAGKQPKQPGYGQGANLGAGYENGYSHKGYGNGFRAGVQPDYASLGQSTPSVDGKSGGADQSPYNGAQMVPAGLEGLSQFEPQSAGLGLNGKLSSVYGGMSNLPFGGQTLGAEKTNAKYGIGGLQFAGQAFSSGGNVAGQYGALGGGIGGVPVPGKYGYGQLAYQAHPVALGPEIKSTGKYGLPVSPYQPEHPGLGHNGKLGKYGGGEVAPQALGGEAKPSGKYGNQGEEQPQPRDSTSEGRSNGQYGTAGLPYQPLPVAPDSAGKPYVKGEVPAPASAAGGEGDGYDNVGYINGQVQPEVVAFSPTLAYPSVPSYLTAGSHLTSDVTPGAGTASLSLDSAPAMQTQGELQAPEQPDELPRQIHIQQHLKLHFHPKNKSWRGANNEKHDLKGFFGNSGYQG